MESRSPAPNDPMVARYHDGELDPEQRIEVERRIEASPPLRDELRWLCRLGAGLRHGAPEAAPPGLTARIMARIRAMQGAEPPLVSLLPLMTRLAVAAAVLLLVAAAVFVLQRGSHRPELVEVKRAGLLEPVRISIRRTADDYP